MLRKRTRNKRLLALILAGVVATTTCQDFGFVVNAESNYNNLQQKYCKDADENSTEDVEASSEETSVYSESTEDGSENETSENETSEKETSEEEASEKETSEEEASEEKTSDIETEETSDFEVTEQLSSEDEENTTEDITQENTDLETEETDLAVLEANGVNIASYVKVENGKITKYTGSDISNIVIPEKINGVTITAIGNEVFKGHSEIASVTFPDTLKSIGNYAFYETSLGTNTQLGTLKIPASVTQIGYYAFSKCKYLGTVEFTDVSQPSIDGITFNEYYNSGCTFSECTYLETIKLSNNIVTLPSCFASSCKQLETVKWGSNLKYINTSAFENCSSLKNANLSNTKVEKIGHSSFKGCASVSGVVFPNTLSSIGNYAFNGASIGTNTELGKLIIPSSVSYIGYYAFSQCKYLGTVEFTDVSKPTFEGIVFDEYYGSGFTFHGCENLSNIKLSNNIVTLPSYFAYDCKQLEAVQWGSNLKNIHGYAFKNCKALKKLDISKNNITQIGNYAFENCTSLEEVIFSNTLETIGNNAFHGASMGTNTKLGTVVIPASVGSVGYYAFSECQYLGYVVFEDVSKPTYDGVMLVDYYGTGATFMNCPRLVSIKTSNNVKKIPSYFASGCPKLTSITFASDELTIEKKAFYVNNKTVTAVDGNSPAINKYDWASDNRVLKSKYTIIFHNNMSDNKTSSQVVPRDAATALLSNPFVNEGHTFVNWNTKPDGSGTSYSNNANIKNLAEKDKTIHLYAQWKVKTYQLTLHANGGKIGNAATKKITLKYGETYGEVLKYNPVFTGWDFAGWYTSEGEDAKTYDWSKLVVKNDPIINLYAHWTTLKYNVVLDANTTDKFSIGSVITGKGVKVNAKAGQIYNSEGVVKSTMNSIYYGLAIEYGEYIKLTGNEYLRPGYTLAGWNTKPNGSGTKYLNESVMPLASKDITLYAQWKLNTYKIKYDLDDGKNSTKNPNKYTVLSGDIELSAPTKEGAKFAGWIDSNGKVITKIASGSHKDMFLKAKWEDIKYTIVYHNSSSYSSVTEDYTVKNIGYSDKVNLIDAAKHFKVKNEYAGKNSIVGWTTKAGGKGNKYSLDKSYSKLTKKDLEVIDLYAVWGANSYEIIYNLNGGVNHKNNPMIYTYNSKKAVSISKPTRAGYIFDGWEASGEAATGFAKGKIAAGTTGNLKLTAKWKNISYIVKLDKNNSYATKNPGIVENYDLSYDQAKTISAKSLYVNDYYELTGFNTKANGKGEFVPIDSNGNMVLKNLSVKNNAKVNLYAQWKIHEYKITYVNLNPNKTYNPNNSYNTQLRGVKNKNAEVYVPTKKLTFSKPTCAGYVFVGWYKDAACTQKITSIPKGSKGNIVVYSKWKTK